LPANYAALLHDPIKLVASVKIADMPKLVEPSIAAISAEKAFY
jgi:hypothetical protein